MKYVILCGLLAGCAIVPEGLKPKGQTQPVDAVQAPAEVGQDAQTRPQARPVGGAPAMPEVVEQPAPQGDLGSTVASLGSPAEPGLWLKTPLVSAKQAGKVSYNGKTIDVTLIPIEGSSTAGSRMSLPAFQALGVSLTDLPEVAVST